MAPESDGFVVPRIGPLKLHRFTKPAGSNLSQYGHIADQQGNTGGHQGHTTDLQSHIAGHQGHITDLQGHTRGHQGHATDFHGYTTDFQGHSPGHQGHTTDFQGQYYRIPGSLHRPPGPHYRSPGSSWAAVGTFWLAASRWRSRFGHELDREDRRNAAVAAARIIEQFGLRTKQKLRNACSPEQVFGKPTGA